MMKAKISILILALILFLACKSTPTSPESTEERGTIQVNSSPSGAQIWLDGANTGQVTNAVLNDIPARTHTLTLIKEGYQDHQQSVSVEKGMTIQVNVVLSGYKITVTSPRTGTLWVARKQEKINWTTTSSLATFPLSLPTTNVIISQGISDVKIDLYEDGSLKTGIVSSTPNSGEYSWQIPKEIGGGSEYRVRVSVPNQPNSCDSDPFTICYNVEGTYQGTITVTQGTVSQTMPVTYVQSQDGKSVSGTWTATPYSGSVKGTINQAKIDAIVTLNGTPPSEIAGTMDIEESGDRLKLVFSGYTSVGFLNAEFVVTRT
jgi:hypothetical protein